MKPAFASIGRFIAACIMILCAATTRADTPEQIRHELSRSLLHHTVYIRLAYHGSYLHYDSEGRLLNHVDRGYWTESGAVNVTRLEMFPTGILHLEAERIAIAFAHGQWTPVKRQQLPVVLEVQFTSTATLQQVQHAIARIFATDLADLAPDLPDYWQPCVTGIMKPDPANRGRTFCFSNNIVPDLESHAPVKTTVPRELGSIIPAHAVKAPQPTYTDVARELQFNGSSIVWLVVDEQGRPAEIYVASPVGYGLDDQAVNALLKWRFSPARQNGKPIRVQMTIEVNFKIPPQRRRFMHIPH